MEKIYCCGDRGNDATTAMLLNGNQWSNNPFWAFILLAMFRNGGFGFGDGAYGNAETQRQIATLQNTVADNHNADLLQSAIRGNADAIRELATNTGTNFNNLQQAICNVRAAIEQVGGQVGFSAERVINAVNLGDMNIVQQLKDCCCQTQQNILKMGYDNQLATCQQTHEIKDAITGSNYQMLDRLRDLGNGISQGFASTAYETQRQTCEIINSGKDNTQRIIDEMNKHWQNDTAQQLAEAKLKLSQQEQNNYIASLLKQNGCGCNC